ncbi:MAG: NTP transferase domain-containing protein [Anaerolineae bacterium]|nr:NTP transferase domain-containing protein [Anaerolineae bacterium]
MSQFIFPDNTKPPIALILAGSDSTHLWPLAEKSLLRFAGATLLQRHLDALAQLGLEEVIIVASSANIEDARAEARAWQKRRPNRIAEVVEQPAPLGMGDAILKAKDALNRREGWPIYVTTAHDVVDPRLHVAILEAYCRRDAHSYLADHRQRPRGSPPPPKITTPHKNRRPPAHHAAGIAGGD